MEVPKMKSRIQEALRRRHRRGDEGFTLIELLVVILIIAILAAVGIVALLSALNSGKKSAAKTTIRNAISSVKAEQTGLGQTDFANIIPGTATTGMNASDPDLTWQGGVLPLTGNTNRVRLEAVAGNTQRVILTTRADNGICYFATLNSNGASGYALTAPGTAAACATPAPMAATGPIADPVGGAAPTVGLWYRSTGSGWGR